MRLWFASFAALQGFDSWITDYALSNSLAQEANPLALLLWESYGFLGLLVPKLIGSSVIGGLVYSMRGHRGWLLSGQLWTTGLMGLVAAWNTWSVFG